MMLMGLTNAPAAFVSIINNLLIDILDKGVVVFLDDILIDSIIVEEPFELLKMVFTCFHKHVFYCKLKKCNFLQKTTTFLGFVIALEGMHISNLIVRSFKEWPNPTPIL